MTGSGKDQRSESLSVLLCTHNPRKETLDRVLEALRGQRLAAGSWEFLIIDNGSADPVDVDLSWHPRSRIVREDRLGLTFARVRGIAESSGDVLVFVDDDNVLEPDYLEEVLSIAREWPRLGIWGGLVKGEFEVPPPAWTRPHWDKLAINEGKLDRDRWGNLTTTHEAAPCGAGVCVRRSVAELWSKQTDDPLRRYLGRQGNRLFSCEDSDLAFTACDHGWGTGIFKAMRLRHLIPANRLTVDYQIRLEEGLAFSGLVLRWLRGERELKPIRTIGQRILYFYAAWRLPAIERKIMLARLRGQERAWQTLQEWSAGKTGQTEARGPCKN